MPRINPTAYTIPDPLSTDVIRTYVDSVKDALEDIDANGTFHTAYGGGGTATGVPTVINAKDAPYNAVGNGTTVDTAAIQAAIDAAAAVANAVVGGVTVYLPPGDYRTGTLRLKHHVRLVGAGVGSILSAIDNIGGPVVSLFSTGVRFASIESLRINGRKAAQTTGTSRHGIFFDTQIVASQELADGRWRINRVLVFDCKDDGIRLTGRDAGIVSQTWVINCDGNGVAVTGVDSHFEGVEAGGSGLHGFSVTNANNRFVSCKAWYNGRLATGTTGGHGFMFSGSSRAATLTACESQDNNGHGYLCTLFDSVAFTGCIADSNGANWASPNGTSAGFAGSGFAITDSDYCTIAAGIALQKTAEGHPSFQQYALLRSGFTSVLAFDITNSSTSGAGHVSGGTGWGLRGAINRYGGYQGLTFATSMTPNPTAGSVVGITLTANCSIQTPAVANTWTGQELTFVLQQDATGGRVVTFAAGYKTAWTPVTTANQVNSITFRYDGNLGWTQVASDATAGGGSSLTVQDESVTLGTATTLNVTGAGATASLAGSVATLNIPGGTGTGGGGVGGATLTVAASNTPTTLADRADYRCTGLDDQQTVQQAWDAVVAGPIGHGTITLLPGTYYFTDTLSLGHATVSATTVRCAVVFDRGATVQWATVYNPGVGQALIKVESSDVVLWNPRVVGKSSTTDVSVGISIGGPEVPTGGRWSKAAYRGAIHNPMCSNLGVGIRININDSSSSGDHTIWGGFLTGCGIGVDSIGFVNRLYGPTMANCGIGINVSPTRFDSKIEVYGATINNWKTAGIRVRGGIGSSFHNIWMEHTDDAMTPPDGIVVGSHTSFGDPVTAVAYDTLFSGETTMHCNAAQVAAIRMVNAHGFRLETIRISTNGHAPKGGIIRAESYNAGLDNVLERIRLYPGSGGLNTFRSSSTASKHKLTPTVAAPVLSSEVWYGNLTFAAAHGLRVGQEIKISGMDLAAWNGIFQISSLPSTTQIRFRIGVAATPGTPTSVFANAVEYYANWSVNEGPGALTVKQHPDAVDTPVGRIIGALSAASPIHDYSVFFSADNKTYWAENREGHVVAYARDAANVVGLRYTIDQIKAPFKSIYFGPGTYTFSADPLGKYDHGVYNTIDGLTFSGAGMWETVIANTTNVAEDTEPFSFTNCQQVTIQDMTVSAGGSLRLSSDAIDFDGGCDCVVARVRVVASRGRGIVFDGKDTGWQAVRNTLRDCIVDGTGGTVLGDGYEMLASGLNHIENCKAILCSGHGFQEAKSSPTAGQPNKSCIHNRWVNCYADSNGADGFNLQSSLFTQLVSCTSVNNSQNAGGHDGLQVTSGDGIVSTGVRVMGGTFGDTQGVPTQRYGINVNPTLPGEVTNLVAVYPTYSGNYAAPTNNTSTGATLL